MELLACCHDPMDYGVQGCGHMHLPLVLENDSGLFTGVWNDESLATTYGSTAPLQASHRVPNVRAASGHTCQDRIPSPSKLQQ